MGTFKIKSFLTKLKNNNYIFYVTLSVIIFFNGCSIAKLPYKAVKTGYKATKTVVKGAAAVGDALVPDGENKFFVI